MTIDDRVGALERETARHGEQLKQVSSDVQGIQRGVDRLLERDSKRPSPITPQGAAMAAAGLGSVGALVWWLIGTSPSVQDLDRRLTRLDDPDIGRVRRIEKQLGWQTNVNRPK